MNWDPKRESIRLWSADPCGGQVGAPEGTPEFFRRVETERYGSYAPWLAELLRTDAVSGRRVLEIGCGLGTDLMQFARAGARVAAVDLTPRHLALTRQRFSVERQPVDLIRGDAESLPLAQASVDFVYSFGVLHHTPDIAVAIAEVHRVLVPGGTALIAVYHRRSVFLWAWLLRALVTTRLMRHGYRRVMADIEQHPNSGAVPLVAVYGVGECRRLFRAFAAVDVSTHHVAYAAPVMHLARALSWSPAVLAGIERSLRAFGWYVVVRARK
jgi:SAM-dependent methyltransferase